MGKSKNIFRWPEFIKVIQNNWSSLGPESNHPPKKWKIDTLFAAGRHIGAGAVMALHNTFHNPHQAGESPEIQENDSVGLRKSDIKRTVVVAVNNPLPAPDQFGDNTPPFFFSGFNPTRFPIMPVEMYNRKLQDFAQPDW